MSKRNKEPGFMSVIGLFFFTCILFYVALSGDDDWRDIMIALGLAIFFAIGTVCNLSRVSCQNESPGQVPAYDFHTNSGMQKGVRNLEKLTESEKRELKMALGRHSKIARQSLMDNYTQKDYIFRIHFF